MCLKARLFFPAKPAGVLKDDFLFLWPWSCLSVPVSQCQAVQVWHWFLCPLQWSPHRILAGDRGSAPLLLHQHNTHSPRLPLAAACGGEHGAKAKQLLSPAGPCQFASGRSSDASRTTLCSESYYSLYDLMSLAACWRWNVLQLQYGRGRYEASGPTVAIS